MSHTNSLDAFNHIGELLYQVGSISGIVRNIYNEVHLGKYNLTADLERLNTTSIRLTILKNYLLDDLQEWDYCTSSDIVSHSVNPVWFFTPDPELKKISLFDTIGIFIQSIESLKKAAITRQGYDDEIQFLIVNSLEYTYDNIKDSMSGLVKCENDRVIMIGGYIKILMLVGVILVNVCVAVLAFYMLKITKKHTGFWIFIKKSISKSYKQVKQILLDRLATVHGLEQCLELGYVTKLKNINFKINTKTHRRFSWRLTFFVVISLSFYGVTAFHFYEICENYMVDRPRALENLIYRRSSLAKISYFARDSGNNLNYKWYPKSYDFRNSKSELDNLRDMHELYSKNYRKIALLSKLSKNYQQRAWESIENECLSARYGTVAGVSLLIFDAYDISSLGDRKNDDEIWQFIENFMCVQDALNVNYNMIDVESKKIINDQLNLIIYTTLVFSVALALSYVFYYLPFLDGEIKMLENCRILPQMIPEIFR